ncbi:MAG: type II secretion system GspH family protein [Lentisphaeraceae bacterium]|nr:type II secretion system GspH family protein [Lentisphaeraceae bacterium]
MILRKDFTLIELLVVIAIIGVLMTMLMPALSNARKSAKRAVCVSNEKQIGIALSSYFGDSDDYYPTSEFYNKFVGNEAGTNNLDSTRTLNRYLGTGSIALCPGDLGDPLGGAGAKSSFEAHGTSYLVAWAYASWGNADFRVMGVTNIFESANAGMFAFPSKKMVLGDLVWHGNRKMSQAQTRWHDDRRRRFNMLFQDGHVSFHTFPIEIENQMDVPADPNHDFY